LVSANDEPQARTRNASASQWLNGRSGIMLFCRLQGRAGRLNRPARMHRQPRPGQPGYPGAQKTS
jgi:hypothetical protein